MPFTDIHIHALFGVDDGACTEADMLAMVEAAYLDGARRICLTPHFHPGYFGDNRCVVSAAFETLSRHVAVAMPDLSLLLGCEIRYENGCIEWLRAGTCPTLGNTRLVLVDFGETEPADRIETALRKLLGAGYTPILAHAERYTRLWRHLDLLRDLRSDGILVQMDTGSPLGRFGFRVKQVSRRMIDAGLVDIISSDAHDLTRRPPGLSECYDYICKRKGRAAADELCDACARRLLWNGNTTN